MSELPQDDLDHGPAEDPGHRFDSLLDAFLTSEFWRLGFEPETEYLKFHKAAEYCNRPGALMHHLCNDNHFRDSTYLCDPIAVMDAEVQC